MLWHCDLKCHPNGLKIIFGNTKQQLVMKLDERSGSTVWSFFINEFLDSVKTIDRQQAKYFPETKYGQNRIR